MLYIDDPATLILVWFSILYTQLDMRKLLRKILPIVISLSFYFISELVEIVQKVPTRLALIVWSKLYEKILFLFFKIIIYFPTVILIQVIITHPSMIFLNLQKVNNQHRALLKHGPIFLFNHWGSNSIWSLIVREDFLSSIVLL